jgi:hypothetical protein
VARKALGSLRSIMTKASLFISKHHKDQFLRSIVSHGLRENELH